MSQKIDLAFKKGDEVKPRFFCSTVGYWRTGVIISILGDEAEVRFKGSSRYDDYGHVNVKLKDLSFACHHSGAPFESTVLDEESAERDGYAGGYAIGLVGGFYAAGGPMINDWDSSACRHLKEEHYFRVKNNKAFKRGWCLGQERAKNRCRLKFNQPLRTIERGESRPVLYVGASADLDKHLISVNGVPFTIDDYGSLGHGHYEFTVENYDMKTNDIVIPVDGSEAAALLGKNRKCRIVKQYRGRVTLEPLTGSRDHAVVDAHQLWPATPPVTLKRSGYMIVGFPSVGIEETLEEISKRWWEGKGRHAPGAFIISVEQERTNGHDRWVTVKIGGPVEPLPEIVRKTNRIYFNDEGEVTVSGVIPVTKPCPTKDNVVEVDFENGKIAAVRRVR